MAIRRPINHLFGKRFGRWLVLREVAPPSLPSAQYQRYVECRCDCGTKANIYVQNLKRGLSTSCGCWKDEKTAARSRTHGMTNTPEYRIWTGMKRRCLQPLNPSYHNYGGRGITVCERWRKSFVDFLADMGKRPSRAHELDRIDNGRGYEPGNVRWATRIQQANNTRHNRLVTFGGRTLTVSEWAREFHIGASILSRRLRRGWSVERALITPIVSLSEAGRIGGKKRWNRLTPLVVG